MSNTTPSSVIREKLLIIDDQIVIDLYAIHMKATGNHNNIVDLNATLITRAEKDLLICSLKGNNIERTTDTFPMRPASRRNLSVSSSVKTREGLR